MPRTLAETLIAARQSNNGVTLLSRSSDHVFLSYGQLYDRSLAILHHLQKAGVQSGSEVIILVGPLQPFIEVFWACVLGNIIAVPLAAIDNEAQRQKISRVVQRAKNPLIYTDSKMLARLRAGGETFAKFILYDQITDLSHSGQLSLPKPEDVAFIQYSSGSTGDSKGIALTHENVCTNIQDIITVVRAKLEPSLSWMPLTHDMGLIGFHLTPVTTQAPQYLMPTEDFIRNPLLWLERISEYKVTITASPSFGLQHCLRKMANLSNKPWDLSTVRLIFNGAEPISASLCESFVNACRGMGLNPHVMFPVYGLAEASLAVTMTVPGTPIKTVTLDRHRMTPCVSVGTPVPHCQIKIMDLDRKELPENEMGHISIKGLNVTSVGREADGWLETGDIGFLRDGELYITGRHKEMMIINGVNIFPHDLETLLEQRLDIEHGKIAVTATRNPNSATDEILVFIVFKPDVQEFLPIISAVKNALARDAGVEALHVIPIRQLPKTTSGKIKRVELARDFENGIFQPILDALSKSSALKATSENITPIAITLQKICQEVIPHLDIKADDNLLDLGMSSLTLAQMHEQIDQAFPGKIEISDLFDYPSISSLSRYLERAST